MFPKSSDPQASSSVRPANGDIEKGTVAVPASTAVAVATPVSNGWAQVSTSVVPEPAEGGENRGNYEREKVLLSVYQISRFIRVVTVIDIAFIIVFTIFSPIFCILLPFPFCGYWGAKRWNYRLLFVYCMYLLLEIIGGIISAVYIPSAAFITVRIVYVVFNVIIARYATRLCSYILVFEEDDMEFLKHSPMITNIEKSLLC